MNDRIVYTVIHNGVDERRPDRITFASYDERERDTFMEASPNKHYLRKDKQIIDVYSECLMARQRAGAIGRLVLGLHQ